MAVPVDRHREACPLLPQGAPIHFKAFSPDDWTDSSHTLLAVWPVSDCGLPSYLPRRKLKRGTTLRIPLLAIPRVVRLCLFIVILYDILFE